MKEKIEQIIWDTVIPDKPWDSDLTLLHVEEAAQKIVDEFANSTQQTKG